MRLIAVLAAVLVLCVFPARAETSQAATSKRVALLVGQDRYSSGILAQIGIGNVDRDQQLLKASFERAGFATQVVKNLTAVELRERLRTFELTARTAEDAVVYYTGLGLQVDGIDFVSGTDALVGTERPDFERGDGYVPMNELAVAVQSASGFAMVFAEAGREDPWKTSSRGFRISKISTSEAAADASVLIFYGSQPGAGSQDGPPGGNGPFAAAVAKYLVQPGLEVGLFARKVRAEVSRTTGRDQRPELYGELGEREFYFGGASPPANQVSAPVFSTQPRLALVIGNSDYNRDGDVDDGNESSAVIEEGFASDLSNPVNDSEDMKAALDALHFEVTLVQNADTLKLADALFKFEEKINAAKENAIVVIYYAGHAIQVGGANFLLPVGAKLPDADLERLPPAQAELLISQVALPVQTTLLERLKSPNREGLNLVILDACRENPWGRLVVTRTVGARGGSAAQGRFRGLGEVRIDLRRTAIAFATKPGDVAADGAGRNSPYTAALVKLLPTPGVSVIELLNRVNGEVENSTNGHQVPWFNTPALGKTCLGACIPQD